MLDHRMERWTAMISDCLAITLAGLLLSARNVFHAMRDLGRYGLEARRRLQFKARLSQPMMAKLEAIGRHCELFRRKAHNLPAPSVPSMPWRANPFTRWPGPSRWTCAARSDRRK